MIDRTQATEFLSELADKSEHLSTGQLEKLLNVIRPVLEDGADYDMRGDQYAPANAESELLASLVWALESRGRKCG